MLAWLRPAVEAPDITLPDGSFLRETLPGIYALNGLYDETDRRQTMLAVHPYFQQRRGRNLQDRGYVRGIESFFASHEGPLAISETLARGDDPVYLERTARRIIALRGVRSNTFLIPTRYVGDNFGTGEPDGMSWGDAARFFGAFECPLLLAGGMIVNGSGRNGCLAMTEKELGRHGVRTEVLSNLVYSAPARDD